MTLLDAAERFASLDRSQIVLEAERCLHAQDQFSECASCHGICPLQAITGDKLPVVDAQACESCLACIPVCPVGAFQADDDIPNLLNCAAHMESQSIELLCGLHPHPEMGTGEESVGIQLRGCLAGLGSAAFLSLSALGLERVVLRMEACRECRWASLAGRIRVNAEKASDWLGAWGREDQIALVEDVEAPVQRPYWNAKNPPLSRRDLFRMLGRQGQIAMARAMEKGNNRGEKQPGRERSRMLSALAHLPALASEYETRLEGFALLAVSEGCTACGACERACPTGALHFEKDQQARTFSLSFSPRACINCDVCGHVCAPAAITVEAAPTFGQVFEPAAPVLLRSGNLVRCTHCSSWTAERPGTDLCPLCEYRRAHPFGSVMPSGLKLQNRQPGEESHS